jgi:tetratricopeptide (TPR) repeat protein
VLAHFFEKGRWGSPPETGVEGQNLTDEDQFFILMQAAAYLTARELGSPEARICYDRAEPLCHSLGRPLLLHVALVGQWRHTLFTDKLSAAMQIAERVYSLARQQDDPTRMIWAYNTVATTLFWLGDFEASGQNAMHGIRIWRSGNVQPHPEDVDNPVGGCLCHGALSEWHLGEIVACKAKLDEAVSLAKKLNDTNALALALHTAAFLAVDEHNPAEVNRLTSDLIELSTRQNFAHWLQVANIYRGWARSALGNAVEGISWIEQGIRDIRATGEVLGVPVLLARKAEALYLADRTSEALEAIEEAVAIAERFEIRHHCAELHRLRGVFLAAMGADETKVEASFCEAIRIAKEQKSISLQKRAEATYAEYRRQKASASGIRRFRLPLW